MQVAEAHPLPMVVGFASNQYLSLNSPPALQTLAAASQTFATRPSMLEFSSLTVSSDTNRPASNINFSNALRNTQSNVNKVK
jgi:hypothetical protein